MGWWENYKARAKEQYQIRANAAKKDAAELERRLETERGLGNAVLRGIMKVTNFLSAKFVDGITRLFPDAAAEAEALLSGNVMEVPNSVWEAHINNLAKGLDLSAGEKEILQNLYQSIEGASPLIRGLSFVFLYTNIVGFLSGPALGKLNQSLMHRFRPTAPDPAAVMQARGLDPELDKRIWEVCRKAGLTDSDIELYFAATYTRQDIGSIRNIFYRTGANEAWLNHRLFEHGYTPERIEELKKIFPTIPGIQDLIMFQAKEQFEPDLIAKFGLHAEAPTEIYEWTRKLGLSDEWTVKYWGAHWAHPAYAQVMEMLHRRFITEEDVWEWFKLVEIPPYWRELLMKISYSPYTRVDARRMHDIGVLSDEELVGVYMDLGYDREHAEKLVQWTVKYNLDNDKEITRSDILKGYEDGDLTVNDAVTLLKQIGYREDHAYYLVWMVDNEKIRAARLDLIEYVKAQYLSHLIPETEARNVLIANGVSQSRVNELITRWKTIQINNTKLPSKTDLDKMLKAGIIAKERYYQEMGFLGYRKGYVDLYYQLATGESGE